MDIKRITALIEERKEELFELLSSLVKINSENFMTSGNEKNLAEHVNKLCLELGLESEVYSPMDLEGFENHPDYVPGRSLENRPNVTARWRGAEDVDELMLMGHLDTVPIGDLANWNKEPLSGEISDGKIWGRGACDDKYALATALFIIKLLKEEGFEPEFWADGLYNAADAEEENKKLFDGTQTPIVWKYGVSRMNSFVTQEDITKEYLQRIKGYAGKVMYAGTFFKFHGYAPNNRWSYHAIDAYYSAVEECKVDHVLMTAWGDNGNECSVYAVMPALWYAADKLYPCGAQLSVLLECCTGYTKEEWDLCDELNYVQPGVDKLSNAAKYLLHNDFLIGLLDYNTPEHAGDIYRKLLPRFEQLAKKNSPFSYLFASYESLCRVLTRKATYGKRLHQAYQNKDTGTLKKMVVELAEIKKDMQEFYQIYRSQWMKENKGFGFEVIDVRVGGLISRIETVTVLLNDYLSGQSEKIYELEEERLEYFCNQLTGDNVYAPVHNIWSTMYTVNLL